MHNSKTLVERTIQRGGGGKAILAALLLGSMPALAADYGLVDTSVEANYSFTPVETQTGVKFWELNSTEKDFSVIDTNGNQVDGVYSVPAVEPDYYELKVEDSTLTPVEPKEVELETVGGAHVQNIRTIDPISGVLYKDNKYSIKNEESLTIVNSGSIYNQGTINTDENGNSITADFVNNQVTRKEPYSRINGEIYNNNDGKMGNIVANFTNNSGYYNLIYNEGEIGNISGNYINNSIIDSLIYSNGEVKDITGNFINNKSLESNWLGVLIENSLKDTVIGNIKGNFIGNDTDIIINNGIVGDIQGAFIGNSGTAIYNGGSMGNISGTFIGQGSFSIRNTNTIQSIQNSLFANNIGPAVYNTPVTAVDNAITDGIINSQFLNNTGGANEVLIDDEHTIPVNEVDPAGALYTTGKLTVSATDGGKTIFSGNNVQVVTLSPELEPISIEYEPIGIYVGTKMESLTGDDFPAIDDSGVSTYATVTGYKTSTSELTLNADKGGIIIIDDMISGQGSKEGYTHDKLNYYDENGKQINPEIKNYKLNFTGDETGTIQLNNKVTSDDYIEITNIDEENQTFDYEFKETEADITLEKVNLHLGKTDDVLNGNNFTANSGTLTMINNQTGEAYFNDFSLGGDLKMNVDVDLANKTMDRITSDNYGDLNGNIIVDNMNLISDAAEDKTYILFADDALKNNVTDKGHELPSSAQTELYSPIYKYNAEYQIKDDGGYFLFTRNGGSSGNPSDDFNPAVLTTSVSNLAAGQAVMNEAFKYVFEHADAFTQLPSMERYAKINANKYALSTDFNNNLPSQEYYPNRGVWVRPFTTFESMNLKNGPDVDAITYGTLIGYDGEFKEMKNGWHRVFTGYAGYTGSSLNYSGIDTTMNGGLLGFTETFYKGNFWTAITASAGASVGESHSMYGKEDYTSLLAGVGSKTGYNFEFKDGKFIIQPIMFLSYTFVNTFDYKNAAGVNIESDPLHTIQLNPSVRFIANLKNGWQPYASVGMVWNLMNESKVTANNVKLPEMSVKPYVEYGVGIQRNWAEKYTGFLQAMIRNGGRNGIALTGGFRFLLGDENDNNQPESKKEIKTL